tara:strand:+ start:6289 stop:6720 length:432 start_codon:yes stop_codon:yes gene_type:complete
MKIADVLRRLADNIDGHSKGGRPDPALQNPAHLSAVPSGQNVVVIDTDSEDSHNSPGGNTASGNAKAPNKQFLPPLQMKQELLKKAVGVENVYDDGTASEQAEEDQSDDMDSVRGDIVARIKQLSGIPTAAIQELGNDEVFDD